MPPDNSKFENAKFYIDGKEIPCEIVSVDIAKNLNDIDDFGLHFDPEKETTLSCSISKFSFISYLKLIGYWNYLEWYRKLWIRIGCLLNIR